MFLLEKEITTTEDVLQQLSYLHYEQKDYQHIVTLVDPQGHKIIKGYGNTMIEAINDLHSTLF